MSDLEAARNRLVQGPEQQGRLVPAPVLVEQQPEAAQQQQGAQGNDNASAGAVGGQGALADIYQVLGLQVSPLHNRMSLTEQERNQARNIKAAIASADHIDPVTDFMCAQLALCDGDNIEAALERAHHLQCFKEEYGILDSVMDGSHRLATFIDMMPGYVLCFSNDQSIGATVFIFDTTMFRKQAVCTEEGVKVWLGSMFYLLTSFVPDLEAMRQGAILVIETEGYDFKTSTPLNSIKRIWSEIGSVYPVLFRKIKYFNTGVVFNVVISLVRSLLPKYLRNKLDIGCKSDKRLDKAYLTPTLEQANARNLLQMENALRRRYMNELTFRL